MPFSFNPDQTATQSGGVPPSNPAEIAASPSIPNSPLLFMQQRGGEVTVNAYVQSIIVLIDILAIFSAIVIFAYSLYLGVIIKSKKEELSLKQSSFKDYPLSDMKQLSDRAAKLDALLKNYLSIRSPLKLLEDVVEKQVVFSEFVINKEKSGQYLANLTALTRDYPSLIQQLEALSLTQYSKIVPDSKIDKFTQEKNLDLRVKVVTTIFAKGLLPDEIVFTAGAASTTQQNTTVQNSLIPTPTSSTTSIKAIPAIGGTTLPR